MEVLQEHLPLLTIAVRQRAKMEGWLKFELARRADREGCGDVLVEEGYGRGRSDVAFSSDGERYIIELKTPNTNWLVPGVTQKHRPITKNIDSIILDARKLAFARGQGIVSFVLFPVPIGHSAWHVYLKRISTELRVPLSETDLCTRVDVPLGKDQSCEVIVCSFAYPARVLAELMAADQVKQPMAVQQIPRRESWPSGNSRDLSELCFSPEELASQYGLDWLQLAAIDLQDGSPAWLYRHRGDGDAGTFVRVDAMVDVAQARVQLERLLGLTERDFLWTAAGSAPRETSFGSS